MPKRLGLINSTDITYSGAGANNWEVGVISGAITKGTYTNGSGYSDGSEIAYNQVQLNFGAPDQALDIAAGETLTIDYDSTSVIIYLPAITAEITLYPDTNGVLFTTSALTTMSTPDGGLTTDTLTLSEVTSESAYLDETITFSEDTMLPGAALEILNITDNSMLSGYVDEYIAIADGNTHFLNEVLYPRPNVPYLGSDPLDLDNPIFDSRLLADQSPIISYEMKMFIKDNNDEWTDFTDRISQLGRDSLLSYGTFKHTTEKRGGIPLVESSIGKVVLDNSDLFFEGRALGLTTDLGNTAVFHTDDGGLEATWREREVRFQLYLTLMDDSTQIRDMGIYLIKGIDSEFGKLNTTVITFENKMNLLKRIDASVVKDGTQWYRNRPIHFLVEELLKTQFVNSSNELPSSFYINNNIKLDVPDEVGGRAYSNFGRPPQNQNGRSLGASFIRAMEIWTLTGTVTSNDDYTQELTPSSGDLPFGFVLKPKGGDYLVIKGSSNGNDGSYEIEDSSEGHPTTNFGSSDAYFKLKTPLTGTAEAGMDFTIVRIYYIHNDKELWEFIPEGNTHTKINTLTLDYSDTGFTRAPYKLFIKDNILYILYASLITADNYTVYSESTYPRLYSYNGTSISLYSPSTDPDNQPHGGDSLSSEYILWRGPCGIFYYWEGGSGGNNDYNENLIIPFTQKPRGWLIGLTAAGLVEAEDATTPTAAPYSIYPIGSYVPSGFYAVAAGWMTWFIDRGDFEVFVPSWSDEGILVTLFSSYNVSTGGVYRPKVYRYNMYNGVSSITYLVHEINWYGYGMCLAYTDNISGSTSGTPVAISVGDCVYMSTYWVDNPFDYNGTRGKCIIYGLKGSGDKAYMDDTDSWDGTNHLTVINMCQYGTTNSPTYPGFIVVSMNRDDIDNLYQLGRWYFNGSNWTYEKLMTSNSPFTKLKRAGTNEDYDVFIFHKYENRILRYDRSANVVTAMANGAEVVADEGNISTPLIIDKNSRSDMDVIYGVSWTGEDPQALDELKVPNKGVLWKLDKYLTPNIELADFDSLDVAEAIGKLAQACDHIAFFNIRGDFYFVPRTITDFDDYVIEHSGEKSILYSSIKKDKGFSEIYNYFTIIPSVTKVAEIDWEFILIPRNNDPDDGAIEPEFDFKQYVFINSLNNQRRKVRMVCIAGGLVSISPKFKWLTEIDNIEARLGEEVSSTDTQFLLTSTFGGDQVDEGVHSNDFIQFNEPSDGVPIYKEILGGQGQANIAAGGVSTNYVYVDDTTLYNIGDKITLRDISLNKRERFKVINIDPDLGYIELSGTPSGTYVENDDILAPVRDYPAYITINTATGVTIPNGSEVTILRVSAADNDDTRKGWSSHGVTYVEEVISSTVFMVNSVDQLAVGCAVAVGNLSWLTITAIDKTNNRVTASSTTGMAINDIVGAAWVPSQDEFISVPGAGLEIKISEDVYFKPGDVFTIKTDGLVIEDDSRSRKLAVSLTSKTKHGKLDFPTIKNRFIYPVLAEVLSRKLLNFYKDPHYHLSLTMHYFPYIDFVRLNRMATFKIISELLFPYSSNYTRSFYLRSMDIDVKSSSIKLKLVDRSSY